MSDVRQIHDPTQVAGRYEYGLLAICEGVHSFVTGASDEYAGARDELERAVAWLRMRRDTWEKALDVFDELVRQLLDATINAGTACLETWT